MERFVTEQSNAAAEIRRQKKEIRRQIAALKERMTPEERCIASRRILERAEALPEFRSAATVLLYHALPDEVQTAAFLDKWYGRKRLVLPLVVGTELVLKEYSPGRIASGYRSIPEPSADAPDVAPSEIGFALIPGVAFDAFRNRLGRGKGFYDRLLPQLHCLSAGIGYDFQLIGRVPCEPFDRPLEIVVTESKLYTKENDGNLLFL